MGDLAAEQRNQQQAEEADNQLIEQRQGHRRFRQARGAHHHRGRAPGGTRQHTQGIAHQHAVIKVVPGHPAGKRDGNPNKRQDNPQPLQGPQSLTGQQPVHSQCGEDRRGVEEHRHVRRRGQLQTFGNEEELQAEQGSGQQTAAPGRIHLVPAALPADQQPDQQRRHTGTSGRLHHRRDIGRRPLDHHLLHAPDQAQPDHHLQGKPVGAAPGGAHRNTSKTLSMAKTRQKKTKPRPSR
ncbi:hypothetical protein D9M69_525760 [compost metagenome]